MSTPAALYFVIDCTDFEAVLLYLFYFTDARGCQNKYAMVQYWFDGPPVQINVKPHGNSSSSHPFEQQLLLWLN